MKYKFTVLKYTFMAYRDLRKENNNLRFTVFAFRGNG